MPNQNTDNQALPLEKDDYKPGEVYHFNGYVFNEVQTASYNQYTKDINHAMRVGNREAEEMLRNNRHQYFIMTAELGLKHQEAA